MTINQEWDFKELVYNIRRLKEEYIFNLAFFSTFEDDYKRKIEYKKQVRDNLYKLNIKEYQIDLCWEYMNDYIVYFELVHVLRQLDNRKKKC